VMAATGARWDRACTFAPLLDAAMAEFEISTPARQAAFLAQVGHESGGLHWLVELWGPTASQARYETRYDLGNVAPGDGFKYRGRGLLQVTGRANYKAVGDALGVDLIAEPEKLGEPELACRSAAWFWKKHGCNELADKGDFDGISDTINRGHKTPAIGDANGYPQRVGLWKAAQEALA
jgi:putative chitinase